jgi:hypothetical protein
MSPRHFSARPYCNARRSPDGQVAPGLGAAANRLGAALASDCGIATRQSVRKVGVDVPIGTSLHAGSSVCYDQYKVEGKPMPFSPNDIRRVGEILAFAARTEIMPRFRRLTAGVCPAETEANRPTTSRFSLYRVRRSHRSAAGIRWSR